jgi:hypothetical protein
MKIEITDAVIHFLNKKIMEFINFVNQLKEDILGKPEKTPKSSKPNQPTDYPFCYEIILLDSKLVLYRNSLSKEKLHARITTLSVTNFKTRNAEENIKRKTATSLNYKPPDFLQKNVQQEPPDEEEALHSIDDIVNETYYEEMEEISENHFKSFIDESVKDNERNDSIHIDIFNFSIDGRHREKEIFFAK